MIIALASLIVALMIIGFIVNMYLYLHKALPVAHFEREPEQATRHQPHLHDIIFM